MWTPVNFLLLIVLMVRLDHCSSTSPRETSNEAKLRAQVLEREKLKQYAQKHTRQPTHYPTFSPIDFTPMLLHDSRRHSIGCENKAVDLGMLFADRFNDGNNLTHLERVLRLESMNLSFSFQNSSLFSPSPLTSPFAGNQLHEIFRDKWLYLYGDSTMRQLWESFLMPFHQGAPPMYFDDE